VRYLYKIYSPYDGFRPQNIPDRLVDGRFLALGWAKYIDALRVGDEVWIVFTGTGFENGVYVQGLVASINASASTVQLRVRRSSVTTPLTDKATSDALRAAVSVRKRQVFLWPADRQLQNNCLVADCGDHKCLACDVWNGLPQIEQAHYRAPAALRGMTVIPAYWIIPPRCYLYYGGRPPAPWNRRVTEMFAAFKVGEERYSFPLGAGIDAALRTRREAGFDAIIPIPLSPEKAAAGELDRVAALAAELARLTGTRVRAHLKLVGPISKRRMQAQGFTPTQFQARYRSLLQVDPDIINLRRIVLLDDVITKGSTLSVAAAVIRAVNPAIEFVIASAGQMIITAVVADQNGPAW
jgi:hypothetical protein